MSSTVAARAGVHREHFPRRLYAAAWLDVALTLSSGPGRTALGVLWIMLDLFLLARIARHSYTAWLLLVALNVLSLLAFVADLAPGLSADQPVWWYFVAPALAVAETSLLLTPKIRNWVNC